MGTHRYKYNWDFFNIDSEELYYFLGFIAADGYRGNKVYIGLRLRILGNLSFLTQLNEYTKTIYPHKTNAINKKGKENVYIITYNFSTAKAILKWLYDDSNIYLPRKKAKFLEILNIM